MKTILFIFLFITCSQCGILKEDLEDTGSPSTVECRQFESILIIVKDYFDFGNITLSNDIFIDVTKDKETQSQSETVNLSPGIHKWEVKFLITQQPAEEINRVLSIVETTANKTGQLINKNCTTGENYVICHFYINVEAAKPPVLKINKREVKVLNNTKPTDKDEINRLIKLAEAAENKNGESDGKNCKTIDGAVICNVYIPQDSPKQKHKREIEFESEASPTDEDVIKEILDDINAAGELNCTIATAQNATICGFAAITGNECPAGKERADDGTCVPEVV